MIVPEMLITEVKPPIAPAAALAMPKVCRVWFGSRCRPSASSRLAASVSRMTARNTTSMARVGDAVAMARQSTWWSCVQTSRRTGVGGRRDGPHRPAVHGRRARGDQPEQGGADQDHARDVEHRGAQVVQQPEQRAERRRCRQLGPDPGPVQEAAGPEARYGQLEPADDQEHAQAADQAGDHRVGQVVHQVAEARPAHAVEHGSTRQRHHRHGRQHGREQLRRRHVGRVLQPDATDHQCRLGRDHAHPARIAQGQRSHDAGHRRAQQPQAQRRCQIAAERAGEGEADIGDGIDGMQKATDQAHAHRQRRTRPNGAGRPAAAPATWSVVTR